jgi:hypothetical protein
VPVWEQAARPFSQWLRAAVASVLYGFIGGETNQ